MQPAIIVENLGKQFRRYDSERPRRLKDLFIRGPRKLKAVDRFWALRKISFDVKPGCMIGILGHNGSGKSTLLRVIGDVMRPDEGRVKTQGRIGALLELGADFHPDLTGRENVFVSGVITGLTRQEVAQRFDSIIEFAEIEAFIDSPLRTYSTGMQMRLAFSVAIHTEPEILLIDEVLAVGDIAFQRKCFDRITQFKQMGCAIMLVTHDPNQVQSLCDKALWLKAGRLMAYGDPQTIVNQYEEEMSIETRRLTPTADQTESVNGHLKLNETRFGSQEVEIKGVRILDQQGDSMPQVNSGDPLVVEIEYFAPNLIRNPIFGVTINDEEYQICCDLNTAQAGLALPTINGQGQVSLHFDRLDLVGGKYYVNVGIYERNWSYAYDYHWHVYPLTVHSDGGQKGVLLPPHQWDLTRATVLLSSN